MKITIEHTDFLICPTAGTGITALIAANKKAEDFIWANSQGNSLRTGFGLTLYIPNDEEPEYLRKIKAKGLDFYHVHV